MHGENEGSQHKGKTIRRGEYEALHCHNHAMTAVMNMNKSFLRVYVCCHLVSILLNYNIQFPVLQVEWYHLHLS